MTRPIRNTDAPGCAPQDTTPADVPPEATDRPTPLDSAPAVPGLPARGKPRRDPLEDDRTLSARWDLRE